MRWSKGVIDVELSLELSKVSLLLLVSVEGDMVTMTTSVGCWDEGEEDVGFPSPDADPLPEEDCNDDMPVVGVMVLSVSLSIIIRDYSRVVGFLLVI